MTNENHCDYCDHEQEWHLPEGCDWYDCECEQFESESFDEWDEGGESG